MAIIFIFGSFFNLSALVRISSYLIIPSILIYYFKKTLTLLPAIIFVMVIFYTRDVFTSYGFLKYLWVNYVCFGISVFILILFAIKELSKPKFFFIEFLSLIIMYAFLIFLFFSLAEVIPFETPERRFAANIYLLLLVSFLGISFTSYILKSNYASLFIMLTAACLIISEASLFFKLYVIEDLTVNVFYPVFHVFTYYFLIQYALHYRKNNSFLFLKR